MRVWGASALQLGMLLVLAPVVNGLIQRVKAAFQGRHGPGILQPYFTLRKLWWRQEIRPRTGSWVFAYGPRLALGISLAACLGVPLLWHPSPAGWGGDFVIVVGLLALERFVLALAGLDTATPFGGLGSSREVTVGALVEPALFAIALPWMVVAKSTAWSALTAASAAAAPMSIVRFFGVGAAVIVCLAETGRLPVDNPDTHLELTMIHEAMLLEYSGPQLALASLAHMVKQLLLVALVADLFVPWRWGGPAIQVASSVLLWFAVALGLAIAESLSVKLRFFRLPAYLGTAVALASAAAVLQVWGGR